MWLMSGIARTSESEVITSPGTLAADESPKASLLPVVSAGTPQTKEGPHLPINSICGLEQSQQPHNIMSRIVHELHSNKISCPKYLKHI